MLNQLLNEYRQNGEIVLFENKEGYIDFIGTSIRSIEKRRVSKVNKESKAICNKGVVHMKNIDDSRLTEYLDDLWDNDYLNNEAIQTEEYLKVKDIQSNIVNNDDQKLLYINYTSFLNNGEAREYETVSFLYLGERVIDNCIHYDNSKRYSPYDADMILTPNKLFTKSYKGHDVVDDILTRYNLTTESRIPLLDKEGNIIELEQGTYIKCPYCKTYNKAKEVNLFTLITDKATGAIHVYSINLIHECSECKTQLLSKNCSYDVRFEYLRTNLYYDTVDNDSSINKMSISVLKNKHNYFGAFMNTKSYTKKITFNLDDGYVYYIPSKFINSKRKVNALEKFSRINIFDQINNSLCDVVDEMELEESIDAFENLFTSLKYHYRNDSYALDLNDYVYSILFEEIYKVIISESRKRKSLMNDFDSTVADNTDCLCLISLFRELSCKYGFNRHRALFHSIRALITYNINPYVEFNVLSNLLSFRSNHIYDKNKQSKVFKNLRLYKNESLIKEIHSINFKTKLERKLFLELINCKGFFNREGQHERFLLVYTMIRKCKIKDLNNIDKLYNCCNRISVDSHDFIKYLIGRFGETTVVNMIIKLKSDSRISFNLLEDTAAMYNEIKDLDLDLNFKRLRIKDIHDQLSVISRKYRNTNAEYVYSDKFLSHFNKTIQGIEFHVADSRYTLNTIGDAMRICVGSYNNRVEAKELFIVSMRQDDKFIGCLEINNRFTLTQAKALRNGRLEAEQIKILMSYINETKINCYTNDLPKEFKIANNNCSIKKIELESIVINKKELCNDTNIA